jgi:acetyltransferase-like isoleucine patch superfamily enzyme
MTLAYLWRERKRHPLGSRAWLKSWAKRVYNAPPLLKLCWRQFRLRAGGAQVGVLTVVSARLMGPVKNFRIGEESSVGEALIVTHAPVVIGDRVTINDGVTILTASHDLSDPGWITFRRPVQIDDYAWIAQNSMIMPGVHIGRGAVVGAGAVVGRDVEAYTVVAGNPARPMARTRAKELDYSPVAFLAAYEAWLERPTWIRDEGVIEL